MMKMSGEWWFGQAIAQTVSGRPDFHGGEVVTMSPGGPGQLINCMKCSRCGHSVV